jgi:hypothetical protein
MSRVYARDEPTATFAPREPAHPGERKPPVWRVFTTTVRRYLCAVTAPRARSLATWAALPAVLVALMLLVGQSAGASTYTITPGGSAVTVATTLSGETATVDFTGTAGRRISLKMSGVTITQSYVSIKKPDGTVLVAPKLVLTGGGFIDATTLPVSGTYTILVDPQSTYTGSMTLALYDVPPDVSGSITPSGPPATITTTTPGQNGALNFAGAVGQRVSLKVSAVSMTQAKVWIVRPDGTNLLTAVTVTNAGTFIDTKSLSLAGTYTVRVDPTLSNVGSMTLALYDVPPDVSGAITPGGSPVTVTTTSSGQNARLTFSGAASQRVSLKLSSVTMTQVQVSIIKPDASVLVTPVTVGATGAFIDVKTLPVAGTYTIVVDPTTTNTGSATLTLYDVPADFAGGISVGGAPVTVTTTTPGQNAKLTFTGSATQKISLQISSVTMTQAKVSIINPDATTLVAPVTVGATGTFISGKTLPQSGTYSIVVDPTTTNAGTMTLTLFDGTAAAPGTIVPGGAPVKVTITTPGQPGQLTFAGTAGQRVSLAATLSTLSGETISILKPDATTLASVHPLNTANAFIDATTLPVSGTYTILVQPAGTTTGSVTITLYTVPADASATALPGGAAASISVATPGQNARVTFSGVAGRRLSALVSNDTIGGNVFAGSNVSILNPDSSVLVASKGFTTNGGFIDTKVLPATGTYTIVIDPIAANVGGMTVTLYDVPADVTSPIAPGGAPVTLTMGTPGQNGSATFAGVAGNTITLTVTDATSSSRVSILNPDGSTLVAPTTIKTISTGLATSGTYTIVVDPQVQFTGSVTLSLAATSAPPSAPALTIGESSTASFVGPGPTFYYRPSGSGGTFTVFAAQVGTTALQKVRFPGLSGGITPTALFDDTGSPFSQTYTWATGASFNSTTNQVTAYDFSGRTAASTFGVVPDPAAPVTADNTAAIGSAWRNTLPTVILAPTDAGSGVATTYSTIDGTTPTTTSPTGTSLALVSEGVYTIKYFSVDKVGNTESVKTAANQISIDMTKPSSSTLDPLPSTIRNGQVLTGSASDALSGIASIKYFSCGGSGCTPNTLVGTGSGASASFTWSSQPADGTYSLLARAFDAAGNSLDSASRIVTIDNSLPDTSITASPAVVTNQTGASFSFSATEAATFQCQIDGGALAACTSPKVYAGLAAGSHTFSVVATDAVGNVDPTPASFTWTVDLTPPDTTITATPVNPTSVTSASFSFTSTEAGTFQCQIDGGGFAACASPKTYSGLSSASHTFQVRAVDTAGNVDASPASFTWVIDTTPPDTTITAGPSGSTSQSSATFSFTSTKSGSSFQCRLDGGSLASCTSPVSYSALADGSHTFTVVATDSLGNVDATPATRTWTIDTIAPDTSITASPAVVTNQTGASFSFSATEAATFQCQIDGGALAACTSPKVYAGLAAGSHTFSVVATDAVGNVDPTPASFTWTVDLTPPDTTITATPVNPTSVTSASFSFTSTEAGTFQCQIDGGGFAACASPKTYSGLSSASHTFQVRAVDTAGNVDASPASFTWVIDTTPPDTTITAGPSGSTSQSSATFSFTSTKSGSSFQCRLDGGSLASCTSPVSYSALADGSHTFTVVATDSLGNVDATPATRTWTIDTIAPDSTVTGSPSDPSNVVSPSFTFTSTETGTFQCQIDGGAFGSCTSPYTAAGLSEGPHTFAVRATDTAGNTDPTPASFTWTVDLTPPAAPTINSAPSGRVAQTSATISFSDTDATASSFGCRLDGLPVVPAACTNPVTYSSLTNGSHTFAVVAFDGVGNASTATSTSWTVDTVGPAVSVTAPSAGSSSSNTTPSLSGLAGTAVGDLPGINVNVYSGVGTGGTIVETLSATASAGSWSAASSSLADGVYTVVAQQTDDLGNVGTSPQVTFTIDTVAPVAPTIASSPAATSATTSASFGFTDGEGGVTFRCALDGAAVTACTSPRAYTSLAQGGHSFAVAAVDAAGNVSSGTSYSWTVQSAAPTISAKPAATSATTAPAFTFSDAPYSSFQCKLDVGAFAACGGSQSYSGLAAGSHTFTVHALDASSVATADTVYTWTINITAPSITAKPPITGANTGPSFSFSGAPYTSFACKLDAGAFVACTSPKAYSGLADGTHSFVVHALDANGVATPDTTYTWTVNTAAPAVALTTKVTGGTTTATATFSHPAYTTFQCALDGAAFTSCTSGAQFAVATGSGLHTVNVRAVDGSGVTTTVAHPTFTA